MMAAKARLFGDQEALAAILGADEPLASKKIGRTVRDYDDGHRSAARSSSAFVIGRPRLPMQSRTRRTALAPLVSLTVTSAPWCGTAGSLVTSMRSCCKQTASQNARIAQGLDAANGREIGIDLGF